LIEKGRAEVRKLDELGRICLPVDMRMELLIESGTLMAIDVDEDRLVFRKAVHRCYICGSEGETKTFMNREICVKCINDAKNEDMLKVSCG
jgi:transcriptional pleiotropic regulator of transition state genes